MRKEFEERVMKKFTASEVRELACRISRHEFLSIDEYIRSWKIMNAYADRLEADEKAMPVGVTNGKVETIRQFAEPTYRLQTVIMKDGVNQLPFGTKLYTHPAPANAERFNSLLTGITPGGMHYGLHGSKESVEAVSDMLADAERLAEALRQIQKLAANGPDSMTTAHIVAKRANALAARSAQEQPHETMTPRELAKRVERGENWKMVEEPIATQPPAAGVQDESDKYHELLYAVQKKFPNESRHATALRYIQQTELTTSGPTSDSQENPNG